MLRDPDKQAMEKAYARWAPVYDVLCGPVFVNGRRAAARAARAVGGRILEIGVGTGLSFDDYDATTEITGIDLSEPMIARARERLGPRPPSAREGTLGDGRARPEVSRRKFRLRGRAIRHHAGRGSRTRALRMRARAQAGRADRAGQSSLFGTRACRRARANAGAEGAVGSACGRSFRLPRLAAWAASHGGAELIERRKVPAVRRLHAGALSPLPGPRAAA